MSVGDTWLVVKRDALDDEGEGWSWRVYKGREGGPNRNAGNGYEPTAERAKAAAMKAATSVADQAVRWSR